VVVRNDWCHNCFLCLRHPFLGTRQLWFFSPPLLIIASARTIVVIILRHPTPRLLNRINTIPPPLPANRLRYKLSTRRRIVDNIARRNKLKKGEIIRMRLIQIRRRHHQHQGDPTHRIRDNSGGRCSNVLGGSTTTAASLVFCLF
jgi:hypothetical protein